MVGMYDLFSTNSQVAGFRLDYMEIYNWGTFDGRIYKIEPQSQNSLLTGANGSGKSTLIDALLTLLVPAKKDRFYNQSSGDEKKGGRTEESYVLGSYGNEVKEGNFEASKKNHRDKQTAYSVLLACFKNVNNAVVTIFQVRWFASNVLKCHFGVAYKALTIQNDFWPFDQKFEWKRKLEKKYNTSTAKKQIVFYDTIKDYKDRLIDEFGMRSDKALVLFNKIVGVKVLEDLDEFISQNMLEYQDAEKEYSDLNENFRTLMEAKTNIEKVEAQIGMLSEIDKTAKEVKKCKDDISGLQTTMKVAEYWFAQKNIDLSNKEIERLDNLLRNLNDQLSEKNVEKEKLKNEEAQLLVDIKNDAIGNQLSLINLDLGRLNQTLTARQNKHKQYSQKISLAKLQLPTNEEDFLNTRNYAQTQRKELDELIEQKSKECFAIEADNEKRKKDIDDKVELFKQLKNKPNNIPVNETRIREAIADAVGAKYEEIPFVGELIQVKDEEKEWENTTEKILHNFALRLIVPDKYYREVNEYVNTHNLNGRIVYQRYSNTFSMKGMSRQDFDERNLVEKIDIKRNSPYADWIEDCILNQYNYLCVNSLEEFHNCKELVATKQGLIKSKHGKHEKDDRKEVNSKNNYVLGWDNREKLELLRKEISELQELQKQELDRLKDEKKSVKSHKDSKELFDDIFKKFEKFSEINWQETSIQIQDKSIEKERLEKTNNHVKELQAQLSKVQKDLKELEDVTIGGINKEIYQIETSSLPNVKLRRDRNEKLVETLEIVDTSIFEENNPHLLTISIENIDDICANMSQEYENNINGLKETRHRKEIELSRKMSAFKNPDAEITDKFKDWRSDTQRLSSNYEYVNEYQQMLSKLEADDLVRFKNDFNKYLEDTVVTKVQDFKMFFERWEKNIKDTIKSLNDSLKGIDFKSNREITTFVQLKTSNNKNDDVLTFRNMLDDAIPNFVGNKQNIDGNRIHFENKIRPLITKLSDEAWRKKVMDVRSWSSYKTNEINKDTNIAVNVYNQMQDLSGGEKAQLTYTILAAAIAFQFGLTKTGMESKSFRFIAIDEAFKAQDEDKANYLLSLCKQLNLQLLVVTPSDNIHIVQNDISFVHYVEKVSDKSHLYNMPIEKFIEERENFMSNDQLQGY